jgi:hypothetical protein
MIKAKYHIGRKKRVHGSKMSMHECMCVCMYMYVSLSVCIRKRSSAHPHTHTHTYIYAQCEDSSNPKIRLSKRHTNKISMSVLYIHTHIQYIHIYTHTYIHTYIHTSVGRSLQSQNTPLKRHTQGSLARR